MNSYSKILVNVSSEIDEFSQSEYGKQWKSSWYSTIKAYIQKAIEAKSNEEAEEFLGTILYMLIDSGPITAEISQSLGVALDSLQTKKKRKNR